VKLRGVDFHCLAALDWKLKSALAPQLNQSPKKAKGKALQHAVENTMGSRREWVARPSGWQCHRSFARLGALKTAH